MAAFKLEIILILIIIHSSAIPISQCVFHSYQYDNIIIHLKKVIQCINAEQIRYTDTNNI